MRARWRFVVVALLLAGTALLLQARSGSEIIVPHTPLASFPHTLGNWTATDVPMDQDVLDVLGPGDFLLRDYHDSARATRIGLFIA